MLTREETIKIFENCRCGAGDCNDCPMECNGNGFDELSSAVLHYLKSGKENEPALSANSTSSEVSKDTGSILHLDDSTKEQICQAYDTVDEACTDIIGIYEGMSEREHRAFDIGEAYGKICSTRDKLEKLRGGDGK